MENKMIFFRRIMARIKNIKVTTSTRFWFALIAFFVNIAVFTVGIYGNIDPTSLGTGLALVNAPLYGYIFGTTVRPSPKPTGQDAKEKTNTSQEDSKVG